MTELSWRADEVRWLFVVAVFVGALFQAVDVLVAGFSLAVRLSPLAGIAIRALLSTLAVAWLTRQLIGAGAPRCAWLGVLACVLLAAVLSAAVFYFIWTPLVELASQVRSDIVLPQSPEESGRTLALNGLSGLLPAAVAWAAAKRIHARAPSIPPPASLVRASVAIFVVLAVVFVGVEWLSVRPLLALVRSG